MFPWGVFLLFLASSCFAPGPNVFTGIAMAQTYNLRQSAKFSFGVLLGISALAFVCCLFSAFIAQLLPSAEKILAVLSAIYFSYLAFVTLRSKPNEEKKTYARPTGILMGAVMQLINPQAFPYCLGAVSAYIAPHADTIPEYLLYVSIMGIVAFVAIMLWSVFGVTLQRIFKNRYIIVNIVLALLLMYCALNVLRGVF